MHRVVSSLSEFDRTEIVAIDSETVSIAVLVIGLLFLYNAVRAFMRASIIGGVIWLLLGLWILSWVIS